MTPENEGLVERLEKILDLVKFEGYSWEVHEAHGGIVIRGAYQEEDSYTGKVETQVTRKWLVAPAMTDSEIVQTVFKLCSTSMEHRLREHFTYRGRRVFGPHFDIEDLVMLCKDRENAGGRQV